MAEFVNTRATSEALYKIIREAQKDIIVIVPYINIPDLIFYELSQAVERDVQVTFVYRETDSKQIEKLCSLKNLNLLQHNDVHAKCYFNEKEMLITSMNLHRYSESNNREMGILLNKDKDTQPYSEAAMEANEIISASNLEKESTSTIANGFNLPILETYNTKLINRFSSLLPIINRIFLNKKFVIKYNIEPELICNPIAENIICTVKLDERDLEIKRLILTPTWKSWRKQEIFKRYKEKYIENSIDRFKIYWNNPSCSISLYIKRSEWKDLTLEVEVYEYKNAIDKLLGFIQDVYKRKY